MDRGLKRPRPNEVKRVKEEATASTVIKKKLAKLDKESEQIVEEIQKAEREVLEIQTRRSARARERVALEKKLQDYIDKTKRLEKELVESRAAWKKKLLDLQEEHRQASEPLVKSTSDVKEKLEKLQMKKDDLYRQLHPEMFAVADVGSSHQQSPSLSVASIADEIAISHKTPFDGMKGLEEAEAVVQATEQEAEAEAAAAAAEAAAAAKPEPVADASQATKVQLKGED
mmetsp:Transcript_39909/g.60275  ORF Transcript_39909/g.60275 Transcript_39909/m.60275 type:complete len:229 (-) Transcript_39909:85-771(-)|eukprot:CAMPEP_0194770390 /NCGR_PEP_ID=MMETSP0323_2-20130528/46093_1 /TAXON_ID=2866 ORGANISM="Crypthecodinium cohnii, Strain Seligo" /NCGR_SAMPLE_ID=MMETSP0323_2 /ASSEMBLY_ACC=CAM_ASM_000346 /LENGTH=228 /DNA_ID=CAMNT_0039703933 /DNA_START=1 /DNA_END=687 /DNA_ORIENTATION=+